MKAGKELLIALVLISPLQQTNVFNFYMDQKDILEIRYDLLLKKELPINYLEATTKGPLFLHLPTEHKGTMYVDIKPDGTVFPINSILDKKYKSHHMFYLYK
jgi:hypothetical protein